MTSSPASGAMPDSGETTAPPPLSGGVVVVSRSAVPWLVPGLVLAWTLANVTWAFILLDTRGLNIDESGYLAVAGQFAQAFDAGGALGFLDLLVAPHQHAPVVPALASVLMIAGISPETSGLLVVGALAGVGLLMTWLLAREAAGESSGWIALALAATTPGYLVYSHLFVFVVPTITLVAAALYWLLRSDALARPGWSAAFGAALGLLPQVRTMSVVFAAVLVLVALVQVLAAPRLVLRVRGVGAAAACAVAVVAPWLVASGPLVADYLLGYGYGSQANEYAQAGNTVIAALRTTASSFFVIHSAVLLVGCIAAMVHAVVRVQRRVRAGGSMPDVIRGVVLSGPFPSALLTILGLAALASTANAGSGFGLQLLPAFATCAGFGLARASAALSRRWVRVVGLGVSVLLLVPVLGLTLRHSPFAQTRTVDVPVLGTLTVTVGEGLDDSYLEVANGSEAQNDVGFSEWQEISATIAERIVTADPVASSMAFGFRGYFLNVNSVQLEVLREEHWAVPVVQIEPSDVLATEEAYLGWLIDGAASQSCNLLTATGDVNEFAPAPDTSALEAAAMRSGFVLTEEFLAPDGREIRLWQRQTEACHGSVDNHG